MPATCPNPTMCDELIALAVEAFPQLDIIVNNAGIYGPKGPIEETDWQEWVRAVEINLFGSVLVARAAVPHLRRRGYGKIIQLSGGGATAPLPNLSAYAASKAGIVRFTETLARRGQSRWNRRQRHCAGRAQHPPARRGDRSGTGTDRRGVPRPRRPADGVGRHAARAWCEPRGLPRFAPQRRHHWEIAQRRLGSLGARSATTARHWRRRTSTPCAALCPTIADSI